MPCDTRTDRSWTLPRWLARAFLSETGMLWQVTVPAPDPPSFAEVRALIGLPGDIDGVVVFQQQEVVAYGCGPCVAWARSNKVGQPTEHLAEGVVPARPRQCIEAAHSEQGGGGVWQQLHLLPQLMRPAEAGSHLHKEARLAEVESDAPSEPVRARQGRIEQTRPTPGLTCVEFVDVGG